MSSMASRRSRSNSPASQRGARQDLVRARARARPAWSRCTGRGEDGHVRVHLDPDGRRPRVELLLERRRRSASCVPPSVDPLGRPAPSGPAGPPGRPPTPPERASRIATAGDSARRKGEERRLEAGAAVTGAAGALGSMGASGGETAGAGPPHAASEHARGASRRGARRPRMFGCLRCIWSGPAGRRVPQRHDRAAGRDEALPGQRRDVRRRERVERGHVAVHGVEVTRHRDASRRAARATASGSSSPKSMRPYRRFDLMRASLGSSMRSA
jgi:hypothetical protein